MVLHAEMDAFTVTVKFLKKFVYIYYYFLLVLLRLIALEQITKEQHSSHL